MDNIDSECIVRFFLKLKKKHYPAEQTIHNVISGDAYHRSEMLKSATNENLLIQLSFIKAVNRKKLGNKTKPKE